MKKRIAIIGAGIGGLTLARGLAEHADVTVFEKARGVGGRMSTRYAEPFSFDHGTQFFTARQPAFKEFIAPLISGGIIAPWHGKVITLDAEHKASDRLWFEPHYVAVPTMNNLCKHLAHGLTVVTNKEVAPLTEKAADGWHVNDKEGKEVGVFDWIISTAPPVQTVRLFKNHIPETDPMHEVRLLGCYTLMIGFNQPWKKSWIGAKVQYSPLEWVAINSTKPGRNAHATSIVVHSSNAWAEEHIDDAMEGAQQFLRSEFERITQIDTQAADYFSCHRWRYAIVDAPQALDPFLDARIGLASVGDWCSASRIEDTWLNATALATRVLAAL